MTQSSGISPLKEVLLGRFRRSSEHKWKIPSSKLTVFVSSTFTDTHCERNILQERIAPTLRERGRQYGIDILFIDMRYGVRNENTMDHTTWIQCSQMLEWCAEESAGLFFISLQAEKYGSCLIPRVISIDMYDRLLMACDEATRNIAEMWFAKDENAIPPHYVLRPLKNVDDQQFWNVVLPTIKSGLMTLPISSDHPNHLVGQSVTEWEVRSALNICQSQDSGKQGIEWAHRRCNNIPLEEDSGNLFVDYRNDPDKEEKFKALLARMTQEISSENIIPIKLENFQDYAGEAYEKKWEATLMLSLTALLDNLIYRKKCFNQNGDGVGIPGKEVMEILHHAHWADMKCSSFFGREDLLKESLSLLLSNSTIDNLYGSHLCLVGRSGVGKTAVMAELARLLYEREKVTKESPRPILIRFCGTSAGSTTGFSLVKSLIIHIRYCFGIKEDDDSIKVGSSYQLCVKELHELLAQFPVILLIDSLDQLMDENLERSRLSFLEGVCPHPDTVIVVSCLPDEKNEATGKWIYCYGCDTRLQEAKVRRLIVPTFGSDEQGKDDARNILEQLLTTNHRTLTSSQWTTVMTHLRDDASALHLNLILRVVKEWSSSEAATLDPQSGMCGVLGQILDKIEKDFGKLLTRSALSLITYSVDGISDNEMIDLLSLDDAVLQDVFQYSTPNIRRLPNHVWMRLRHHMEGLLVERRHGCLRWYHRQLQEYAEERYSDLKIVGHNLMGRYFANLIHPSQRMQQRLSDQPVTLTSLSVFLDESLENTRRAREAAFHLVHSRTMTSSAIEEICNLERICACAKSDSGFTLVALLAQLVTEVSSSECNDINEFLRNKLSHYYLWLRWGMSAIAQYPAQHIVASLSLQPPQSLAKQDLENYLQYTNRQIRFAPGLWCRGVVLGNQSDFGAELVALIGHTSFVYCVDFNKSGTQIVSCGHDSSLRIWDTGTGAELSTMRGHFDYVNSVAFHPDGLQVVSGSDDKTVRLWDTMTGSQIAVLIGHTSAVKCVVFDGRGENIASAGCWDNTIRVWDTKTGMEKAILLGHTAAVNAVAFSPCGRQIISGSGDKTGDHVIRVWDVNRSNELAILRGHKGNVNSIAFSPNSKYIASGSDDETVRLWCASSYAEISCFKGHTRVVRAVCFSPDSKRIASGSLDRTLRTWNIALKEEETVVRKTAEGGVNSVAFSPDSLQIACGGDDEIVRVWDSNVPVNIVGHKADVNSLAYSPDGSLIVSAGDDKVIHVQDVATGKEVLLFEGHDICVWCVAVSPNGRQIVSAGEDNMIKFWEINGESSPNTLSPNNTKSGVYSAPLSAMSIGGNKSGIYCVTYSPDGCYVVSGGRDDKVRLWNAATSKQISIMRGHTNPVNSVDFSPNGDLIASSSSDTTVRLWLVPDKDTRKSKYTLRGHTEWVYAVAFCPNGKMLASGSVDSMVRLWNAETGSPVASLRGHSDAVRSVGFSPDGMQLASCGYDRTIRLWNVEDFTETVVMRGHTAAVFSVSFNPSDVSQIASCGGDKTVRVWDSSTGDVIPFKSDLNKAFKQIFGKSKKLL